MLGSISPCSLELVGIWHRGTAGWKQRVVQHCPAGAIKPQDLLINVPLQEKGRRWKTNCLHPPVGCRWVKRSPKRGCHSTPPWPGFTGRLNSPGRGIFPQLAAAGSRARPPDRELAAGANASGCDGWL